MLNLNTQRLNIRLAGPGEEGLILNFYLENQNHLSQWDPEKSENFYTEAYWFEKISSALELASEEKEFRFHLFLKETSELIGMCSVVNIERGPFQNCRLGYKISYKYEGQGLMSEALSEVIRFCFEDLRLHRIEANYIPTNNKSAALLERHQFEKYGIAKNYLKIAGRWQDHVLTCLINKDYID